ncbi:hypothetical protein [Flavilitoribacter nigricans]|nr:hypothetical protein [Flavilitoribacter nigricans]
MKYRFMKGLHYLILPVMFLWLIPPGVGQPFAQYKKLMPLEQPENYPKDSILLKYKAVDSTRAIIAFLINRTADTLLVPLWSDGAAAHLEIEFVADNQETETWVVLNPPQLSSCYIHTKYAVNLPPDHYLWLNEQLPSSGPYLTQLRFQVRVNDSLQVLSPLIPARIDKRYLYPQQAEFLRFFDSRQLEVEDRETGIMLAGSKAKTEAYLFEDCESALRTITGALEKYPDADQLHLIHGMIYLVSMGQNDGLSLPEKQLLIGQAYRCWESISGADETVLESIRKFKKVYDPHLLKKSTWDPEQLDCRERDGRLECFLDYPVPAYLEVYFAEEN